MAHSLSKRETLIKNTIEVIRQKNLEPKSVQSSHVRKIRCSELPYTPLCPSETVTRAINDYIVKHVDLHPKIVALCGSVGVGKTWDACALALHVCRQRGFYRFAQCSTIHDCDPERMSQLHRCTALILDDYGYRQTDGALLRAFQLVDGRMHGDRVTIITTNILQDIRKIDERLASRLNTACVVDYSGLQDRRIET